MKKGVVIALEGGEGAGKDEMIGRLKKLYEGRSDIAFSREPGGTQVGEQIRAILMNKGMDVRAELLLFLAARMQLVSEVIEPALAQGTSVVLNRFSLSTEAYQIFGRHRLEYRWLLEETTRRFIHFAPHYVFLDVSPEVGLKRVESRGGGKTRFDAEDIEFHRQVREGYLLALQYYGGPRVRINADPSREDVWAQVKDYVVPLLG